MNPDVKTSGCSWLEDVSLCIIIYIYWVHNFSFHNNDSCSCCEPRQVTKVAAIKPRSRDTEPTCAVRKRLKSAWAKKGKEGEREIKSHHNFTIYCEWEWDWSRTFEFQPFCLRDRHLIPLHLHRTCTLPYTHQATLPFYIRFFSKKSIATLYTTVRCSRVEFLSDCLELNCTISTSSGSCTRFVRRPHRRALVQAAR